MYNEKQGKLEDLDSAPLQQLEYLLRRQENILNNSNLVRTLPDGGEKVSRFASSLKERIARKKGVALDDGDNNGVEALSRAFSSRVMVSPMEVDTKKSVNDESGTKTRESGEKRTLMGDVDIVERLRPAEGSDGSREPIRIADSRTNTDFAKPIVRVSKFKADRVAAKSSPPAAAALPDDDVDERRNVLREIFAETRQLAPSTVRFKPNVPLKSTDPKVLPKPEAIVRLAAARPASRESSLTPPEDCLHPPSTSDRTTALVSLAESLELQKKLKASRDNRVVADAVSRLAERFKGASGVGAASVDVPERPWLRLEDVSAPARLGATFKSSHIEGSFVEYREKKDDDDDLDDAVDREGIALEVDDFGEN